MKVCIICNSDNLTEIVEKNLVKYYCSSCKQKSSRYLDRGRIKKINTNYGIKHQVVKAIIKNGKGQILFIKRRTYPFGITIPAGHIDNGETSREALDREVFEETGLRVKKAKLFFKEVDVKNSCRAGTDYHDWFAYECETQGTVMENYEIDSVFWSPPEEGPNISPRNKTIFEAYINYGK